MPADQTNGLQDVDRSLGEVVNRISENASTLVREEIELAKTEIELKVSRLARGAAVAVAAGFFLLLGADLRVRRDRLGNQRRDWQPVAAAS